MNTSVKAAIRHAKYARCICTESHAKNRRLVRCVASVFRQPFLPAENIFDPIDFRELWNDKACSAVLYF
ncbi:hypothetical protein [Pseudomethylobacillus aquaticus]|uniref:hypothetical protein n=1 Tax=Pseudomethylobacillus aquaticus TaxID=2676064 RepID=UPI0011CD9FD2|nr:hypothetical protein [Pseudomethylobacillus aquaticus]